MIKRIICFGKSKKITKCFPKWKDYIVQFYWYVFKYYVMFKIIETCVMTQLAYKTSLKIISLRNNNE